MVLHAGRAAYDELLDAGVKIFERRAALLHSKTAVIDGVWSTVGSTNLDWRSFLHNQELDAVVLGAGFGAQMRAVYLRDLAESDQVTLEGWRSRGIAPRVKELIGQLWAYWL
jgi:cardiolipin synthase